MERCGCVAVGCGCGCEKWRCVDNRTFCTRGEGEGCK